jgi:hypothetical protein
MRVVTITQTAVLVLVRMNVCILVTKQGQICSAIALAAVCQIRSGSSTVAATAASATSVDEVNVTVKASKRNPYRKRHNGTEKSKFSMKL